MPATSGPDLRTAGLSRPTAGRRLQAGTRAGPEGRNHMPGMLERIKRFVRSPQGRRTVEQARRAAADPRRRAQAQRLLGKLRGRR